MADMENRGIIQALQNPSLYDHPIIKFQVIETHLSWVLLTGHYAYKIKKAIDLKFADFSTLEKRYFYCLEEFRLNQTLAGPLYIEVLPIYGSFDALSFKKNMVSDSPSRTIEYAIKMNQFDQEMLLSHLVTHETLDQSILEKLAESLADFHQYIPVAEPNSHFGNPDSIQKPVSDNFLDCKTFIDKLSINTEERKVIKEKLALLEKKTNEAFIKLKPLFEKRKEAGFIRGCHGDCHLGNIVLFKGEPVIFDCIEFNEDFRWIDVVNEIAFLTMDLQARKLPEAAFSFLNTYLEITGDYEGLSLLRFYQSYRAMVRAKVALLSEQPNKIEEFSRYLHLASEINQLNTAQLIITYGVSGSGKTFAANKLAKKINALHLRSDIERRRMQLPMEERYSKETHLKIYAHLLELSKMLLENGYSVIVDATFLRYKDREKFNALADKFHIPFSILQCQADLTTLQQRIIKRSEDNRNVSEADLDVLEMQLATQEPLKESELKKVIDPSKRRS